MAWSSADRLAWVRPCHRGGKAPLESVALPCAAPLLWADVLAVLSLCKTWACSAHGVARGERQEATLSCRRACLMISRSGSNSPSPPRSAYLQARSERRPGGHRRRDALVLQVRRWLVGEQQHAQAAWVGRLGARPCAQRGGYRHHGREGGTGPSRCNDAGYNVEGLSGSPHTEARPVQGWDQSRPDMGAMTGMLESQVANATIKQHR